MAKDTSNISNDNLDLSTSNEEVSLTSNSSSSITINYYIHTQSPSSCYSGSIYASGNYDVGDIIAYSSSENDYKVDLNSNYKSYNGTISGIATSWQVYSILPSLDINTYYKDMFPISNVLSTGDSLLLKGYAPSSPSISMDLTTAEGGSGTISATGSTIIKALSRTNNSTFVDLSDYDEYLGKLTIYDTTFTITRQESGFSITRTISGNPKTSIIPASSFPQSFTPYILGIIINSAGGSGGRGYITPEGTSSQTVARAGAGGGGGAKGAFLIDFSNGKYAKICLGKNSSNSNTTIYINPNLATTYDSGNPSYIEVYSAIGTVLSKVTLGVGQNGYTPSANYSDSRIAATGGKIAFNSGIAEEMTWDSNHSLCCLAYANGGDGGLASVYGIKTTSSSQSSTYEYIEIARTKTATDSNALELNYAYGLNNILSKGIGGFNGEKDYGSALSLQLGGSGGGSLGNIGISYSTTGAPICPGTGGGIAYSTNQPLSYKGIPGAFGQGGGGAGVYSSGDSIIAPIFSKLVRDSSASSKITATITNDNDYDVTLYYFHSLNYTNNSVTVSKNSNIDITISYASGEGMLFGYFVYAKSSAENIYSSTSMISFGDADIGDLTAPEILEVVRTDGLYGYARITNTNDVEVILNAQTNKSSDVFTDKLEKKQVSFIASPIYLGKTSSNGLFKALFKNYSETKTSSISIKSFVGYYPPNTTSYKRLDGIDGNLLGTMVVSNNNNFDLNLEYKKDGDTNRISLSIKANASETISLSTLTANETKFILRFNDINNITSEEVDVTFPKYESVKLTAPEIKNSFRVNGNEFDAVIYNKNYLSLSVSEAADSITLYYGTSEEKLDNYYKIGKTSVYKLPVYVGKTAGTLYTKFIGDTTYYSDSDITSVNFEEYYPPEISSLSRDTRFEGSITVKNNNAFTVTFEYYDYNLAEWIEKKTFNKGDSSSIKIGLLSTSAQTIICRFKDENNNLSDIVDVTFKEYLPPLLKAPEISITRTGAFKLSVTIKNNNVDVGELPGSIVLHYGTTSSLGNTYKIGTQESYTFDIDVDTIPGTIYAKFTGPSSYYNSSITSSKIYPGYLYSPTIEECYRTDVDSVFVNIYNPNPVSCTLVCEYFGEDNEKISRSYTMGVGEYYETNIAVDLDNGNVYCHFVKTDYDNSSESVHSYEACLKLTVKHYISNTLNTTTTHYVVSGTTITPSNYKDIPAGYYVYKYNPSQARKITSDDTLEVYYLPSLLILNIYVYLDSSLNAIRVDDTVQAGTLVDVDKYASNSKMSGYRFNYADPSSNFYMTSDSTLKLYYTEIPKFAAPTISATRTSDTTVSVSIYNPNTTATCYYYANSSSSSSVLIDSNSTKTVTITVSSSDTGGTVYAYFEALGEMYLASSTSSVSYGVYVPPLLVNPSITVWWSGADTKTYSLSSTSGGVGDTVSRATYSLSSITNGTIAVTVSNPNSISCIAYVNGSNIGTVSAGKSISTTLSGYSTISSIPVTAMLSADGYSNSSLKVAHTGKWTETLSKSVTVDTNDVCFKSRCNVTSSVSGDTSYVSYTTELSGMNQCCDSESICITVAGCPMIFKTCDWNSTITES